MAARLLFILATLLMVGCGGGEVNILPEPFTRERADGKIPVKTELIREQVLARLAGIPEGEAEVLRWQHIETDYHACRLSSKKAAGAAEEVFANCMANRGYVYMYRIDAEQLHNDIEFEIEKEYDKHPDAKQKATEEWLAVKRKREEEQQQFAEQSESPDDGFNAGYLYALAGIAGVAAVASGGGGGGGDGNNPSPAQPSIPQIPTMPTITMTMAMTTTNPPPRTEPAPVALNSQHYGAWHTRAYNNSHYFVVRLLTTGPTTTHTFDFYSSRIRIHPQSVGFFDWHRGQTVAFLWELTRLGAFYGESPVFVDRNPGGVSSGLRRGEVQVLVESQPNIRFLNQLCEVNWLATYINANFSGTTCPAAGGLSYSPDMRRVVYAAMADGFNPGLSFTDSPLSFFGRYDNNDRAAGFTYDFGNYALRTDYTRLPSKQDSNVWLDTYRLGVLHPINDEARFFAGVDNYKNAIFVLDTTGEDLHRLGFAVGDGYAVKYEYRLNL